MWWSFLLSPVIINIYFWSGAYPRHLQRNIQGGSSRPIVGLCKWGEDCDWWNRKEKSQGILLQETARYLSHVQLQSEILFAHLHMRVSPCFGAISTVRSHPPYPQFTLLPALTLASVISSGSLVVPWSSEPSGPRGRSPVPQPNKPSGPSSRFPVPWPPPRGGTETNIFIFAR